MGQDCANQIKCFIPSFLRVAHKESHHILMAHIFQETVNLVLKKTSAMMDFNFSVLQMSLLKPREGTQ